MHNREPGRNEIPDLPGNPYHGSNVLARLPWEGSRMVLRLDADGQADRSTVSARHNAL